MIGMEGIFEHLALTRINGSLACRWQSKFGRIGMGDAVMAPGYCAMSSFRPQVTKTMKYPLPPAHGTNEVLNRLVVQAPDVCMRLN